jgi:hypothetical protein
METAGMSKEWPHQNRCAKMGHEPNAALAEPPSKPADAPSIMHTISRTLPAIPSVMRSLSPHATGPQAPSQMVALPAQGHHRQQPSAMVTIDKLDMGYWIKVIMQKFFWHE